MVVMQVHGGAEQQITGSAMLYAIIASVVFGGPLLGMMGFALLATSSLAFVAAPLMLVFSPVLVPAALVLVGATVAFGIAVGMALIGLSALIWAFRSVVGFGPGGLGTMARGSGDRNFGEYLKQEGNACEPRIWQQRG